MNHTPLATATTLAALPEPWRSVLALISSSNDLADARHRNLLARIAQLDTENAELRDELHELSRAFTRHQNKHLLTVVQPPGDNST
jgi:hypothetical protein